MAAIESAHRLNPKPSADTLLYTGIVMFIDGQYQRAIDALSSAGESRRNSETIWIYLAAAQAQLGQVDEAHVALNDLAEHWPMLGIEYYRVRDSYYRRAADHQRLLDGLKTAGLPDWPFGFEGAPADRLTAAELADLVLGRTWTGKHANGAPFVQQVTAAGELAYRTRSSIQTGTIAIRDDRYCQRIGRATLDQELCGYVYRNPGGSSALQDEYVVVTPTTLRYFSPAR